MSAPSAPPLLRERWRPKQGEEEVGANFLPLIIVGEWMGMVERCQGRVKLHALWCGKVGVDMCRAGSEF